MRAANYRIGNYINLDGELHQITHYDIRNLYESELNVLYSDIPITKEWLLKFGFTEGNKCYKNGYLIEVLSTDFYLRPCYSDGFYWGFNESDEKLDCELYNVKPLLYVHELQNLFFAITRTEIQIQIIPKYSKREFDGFTHRFIVKFSVDGDYRNDTNITIYSDSDSYKKLEHFICANVSEKVKSFKIEYRTSKEQDESSSKFLDEILADF